MAEKIRIDKLLVEMGIGSRNQVKEGAKKGKLKVNGQTETKADRKIDPQKDYILWDGKEIRYSHQEYYLLNKPSGVVSATEDRRHQTVVGLIGDSARKDLFPVGRLDIDTEGLLMITNDGELAHRLLSPKKHVDKRYFAVVEGDLPENAAEQFQSGIVLKDGTQTLPADLTVEMQDGGRSEIVLTIREGKFHQVKRMFEACGCQVTYLKRISMGSLTLDERLKPGEYRPLTQEELEKLKKETGL